MTKTHLCNTFFEEELSLAKPPPLEKLLSSNPISLQLQYLPLLYRKKGDRVVVTEFPSLAYLSQLEQRGFPVGEIDLIDRPRSPFSLELWGASPTAAAWAESKGGSVSIPPWDIVREIHSKVYSYAAADSIPHSHLFSKFEDVEEWASSFPGAKVLKKAFGASGSGHLRIENSVPDRARALFHHGEPVVGEPWVERIFDFSTQWEIQGNPHYLGATVLNTSPHGVYLGTLAGNEQALFAEHSRALYEHIEQCRPLLQKIQRMGFFGNIGVDAFIYLWEGKRRLRSVGEINARKTMGWAALEIQKLHFPEKILRLRYERTEESGYLPADLDGRTFPKQLLLDFT